MKNYIILFFIFLPSIMLAQEAFKLSYNPKISFYDKGVIKTLNKELQKYGENMDTSFVYIDGNQDTTVNSFIYVKKGNKINFVYILFNTNEKLYYTAHLSTTEVVLPNVSKLYNILNDSNSLRSDSVIVWDQYGCNILCAFGKSKKQSWVSSTKLNDYVGYISSSSAYEVYEYFANKKFLDKKAIKPAIIETYQISHYKPNCPTCGKVGL